MDVMEQIQWVISDRKGHHIEGHGGCGRMLNFPQECYPGIGCEEVRD